MGRKALLLALALFLPLVHAVDPDRRKNGLHRWRKVHRVAQFNFRLKRDVQRRKTGAPFATSVNEALANEALAQVNKERAKSDLAPFDVKTMVIETATEQDVNGVVHAFCVTVDEPSDGFPNESSDRNGVKILGQNDYHTYTESESDDNEKSSDNRISFTMKWFVPLKGHPEPYLFSVTPLSTIMVDMREVDQRLPYACIKSSESTHSGKVEDLNLLEDEEVQKINLRQIKANVEVVMHSQQLQQQQHACAMVGTISGTQIFRLTTPCRAELSWLATAVAIFPNLWADLE
eukprot:g657.t1